MKKILGSIILLLTICSCSTTSKQNIVYFSDLSQSNEGAITVEKRPIKIASNDELVINVSSEVPEASAIYNLPFNNTSMKSEIPEQSTLIRFQTFIVGPSGYIHFPVLGKIHVAGMTTEQLADYLTQRIGETVENPVVRVELVNFKVQVTGEVKEPQTIAVPTERFTVLDAIAGAGDMTVTGRRDNVLVIRQEDGEITYHRLDLTDSKCMQSPYFYLQQNDVVYVEPGEVRKEELTYTSRRNFNVTVASILVSACSVIASLVIAFAK
jgi:polysaccharide biosynthesis/export protein